MYTVPAGAMTYVSSTTFQENTFGVLAGATKQEIIGVEVVVSGSTSPLSVTSMSFNTNGSTNAATDIANAKVYFTGNSNVFYNSYQFGSTVANPNGAFVVNGSQTLNCGTNYFWLVYDISTSGVAGDFVDAECTSLTIGSVKVPTVTAPIGNREITPCSHCTVSASTDDVSGVTHVIFNTIDNHSNDGGPAYSDYTAISTDVTVGNSYNLTVKVNTAGAYRGDTKAWIDWNQDCDFDDAGEEFYLGQATSVTDGATSLSPLSITIPLTATTGNTIMRVRDTYNSAGVPQPLACGNQNWSEAEDYTINVIGLTPPAITTVTPNTGTAYKDGGKDITIVGTDFTGATSVTLAGVPAHIISNTATQIVIETAGGTYSGTNEIVVTTAAGSGSKATTFTFETRNIIPVGGGTDDHRFFQWALDDLLGWYGTTSFDAGQLPGAKYIDVYAGTYTEVVTPNITLAPSTTNNLVIQNHSGDAPVVNATGKANGVYIGALNNVTVSGLAIYGATNDNIYTEGDANTVQFCKSYNSAGGSGIKLSAAHSSKVKNNLVYGNYNYGIHLTGSNTVETDNNTAYDNGHSVAGSETFSTYSFSGSVATTDLTSVYADIVVPITQIITEIEILNVNITHGTDSQIDM